MKINATQILEKVIASNASDLHITVGCSPFIRVNMQLHLLNEFPPLSVDDVEYFLSQILDTQQRELLEVNKELDFSVALGTKARFRVNAFFQKGYLSAALRYIPISVPPIESLNLPTYFGNLCNLKQGLILVVGPTGHVKSTTIAAMLDRINETRAEHIVTIEDPIEYVFTNKKSLVEQRELFLDTHAWNIALKSILRQDPNVVLIGEINSASQTVERIISSFPAEKQNEIRLQLSQVIEVVISQRLIPSEKKKVVPAIEIMLGSDAVKTLIREGRTHMLDNVIKTSSQVGMVSLEKSLAELIKDCSITWDDGVKYTSRPEELRRLVKM